MTERLDTFTGKTNLRLNLGCGRNIKKGWINVDFAEREISWISYAISVKNSRLKRAAAVISIPSISLNIWNGWMGTC